jgi:hypothetical protein
VLAYPWSWRINNIERWHCGFVECSRGRIRAGRGDRASRAGLRQYNPIITCLKQIESS